MKTISTIAGWASYCVLFFLISLCPATSKHLPGVFGEHSGEPIDNITSPPFRPDKVFPGDGAAFPGGGAQTGLGGQAFGPAGGFFESISPYHINDTGKQDEWSVHRVHSSKLFAQMSNRSQVQDAEGRPHIAYGFTHLYYAWYDEGWHTEIADDSWDVGMYASLALDAEGFPHISYYDRGSNGDLKYAFKDGSGWHTQTVDAGGTVGTYTSLAVDAANHVHISYCDNTNGDLKYAHWNGSMWHIQTIDSEGILAVWSTSIAVDSDNYPHISYFDYTNANLKYTKWNGNEWEITTIDNDHDVGGYSSLVLDSNGYPHISYLDYANANLKYARWNGNNWQIATIDNSGSMGWFNSIALDSGGNPHISYRAIGIHFNSSFNLLKYAFFDGSSWQVQMVTEISGLLPQAREGMYSSIVLDADDRPHISHLGQKHILGGRMALRRTSFNGTKWVIDFVDYHLDLDGSSIAVDSDSHPHIAYWLSDNTLAYRRWDGNQWQLHTFDPPPNEVVYPIWNYGRILALDANNKPHLIFQFKKPTMNNYTTNYPSFLYSWHDGSSWQSEILYYDSFNRGLVVNSASLALDRTGQPHVSVYAWQPAGSAFAYLFRENNQWYSSTIQAGQTGSGNALALDDTRLPHISYESSSEIRYISPKEGQWQGQVIGPGRYASIATDASHFPHISYYNTQLTALVYVRWNGSQWLRETVDNSGDVGRYSSLVIDQNGNPHLSYYDVTGRVLKYAHKDGGQWQIETVDSYGSTGAYTSLALDADGLPHISYYDLSFGGLKYATKRTHPTSLSLAFVVKDKHGESIPDAVISLNSQEYPPGVYAFGELEAGTYDYTVSRQCNHSNEGSVALTYSSRTVHVMLDEMPGDANGDEEVNVSDVIVMVNYFMEQDPWPFCFSNADIMTDETINVQDVICTVNLFMGAKTNTPEMLNSEPVYLYLCPEGIWIDSDGTLAGVQLDILAGKPLNPVVSLTLQNHILAQKQKQDTLTLMVFSLNNAPIPAGYIKLISFDNVVEPLAWGKVLAANVNAEKVEVRKDTGVQTGWKEKEDVSALKVYPNPSREAFWVSFVNHDEEAVTLSLISLHGQHIFTQRVTQKGQQQVRFSTKGLPPGIYLLKIQQQGGSVFKKLMVQ